MHKLTWCIKCVLIIKIRRFIKIYNNTCLHFRTFDTQKILRDVEISLINDFHQTEDFYFLFYE